METTHISFPQELCIITMRTVGACLMMAIQKKRSKNVALRKQVSKHCCMDSNSVSCSVILFNSVVRQKKKISLKG